MRVAPVVEDGDFVRAGDGAERRAGFLRVVLAPEIFHRVIGERDAGIATLLRAVVDEPVLADVEVARAGAASPVVGASGGEIILKPAEPRVFLFA